MKLLHVEYMKLVATGGDLDAATEMKVVQEAVTIEAEGVEIEHILSTSPNPAEIIEAGSKIKARTVLAAADSNTFVDIFGGTYTNSVWEKDQDPRTLDEYDIRWRIASTDHGKFFLVDITHVFVVPKLSLNLAPGKRFYLPLDIKGSPDSVISKDDTNA